MHILGIYLCLFSWWSNPVSWLNTIYMPTLPNIYIYICLSLISPISISISSYISNLNFSLNSGCLCPPAYKTSLLGSLTEYSISTCANLNYLHSSLKTCSTLSLSHHSWWQIHSSIFSLKTEESSWT